MTSGLPEGLAPAKINLALHVTGRRPDGFHLLDSLVVFADIGDRLTVAPAEDLSLTVDGPFVEGIPADDRNIVLRAARTLKEARGVEHGARITLTKLLPHPAGIGGGSSDAATVLRLLSDQWQVHPFAADDPRVVALGADIPVCLCAPAATLMSGIGEVLRPTPPLPGCGLVLANPRVDVPTGAIFSGLASVDGSPLPDLPPALSFDGFCDWIDGCRNDLTAPATTVAPVIGEALALLGQATGVGTTVMSGSGATCVGLFPDLESAEAAAEDLRQARPAWWVTAAKMLT